MKLTALLNEDHQISSFIEIADCEYLLEDIELNESLLAIIEPIKQMFFDIVNTAKTIKDSANKKGELNDVVFRKLYLEEKEKLEGSLENFNPKLKQTFVTFLKKHDIKAFDNSVDIKRNNAHRYLVVKLTRAVLAAIGSLQENAYEAFISILFPGLGTIISAIYSAKDLKSAFREMVSSKSQIVQLVKKARARQLEQGD